MSIGLNTELASRENVDDAEYSRDFDGRLVRMDKVTADDLNRDVVIKIDGREIAVKAAKPATDSVGNFLRDSDNRLIPRPTTVYDAACQGFVTGSVMRMEDLVENPIPVLCHTQYMDPVAVCRLCVVEVSQADRRGNRRTERKLFPACQLRVKETMEVSTRATSEKVRRAVDTVAELLMADHPSPCAKAKTNDCELENLAKDFELAKPRFSRRPARAKDDSSLVIAVDHSACILCDRCIRGCNDIRDNQVIGRSGKGYQTQIAFDLGNPMGNSSCVACGECMIACPTGALTFKKTVGAKPWADANPPALPVRIEELHRHAIPEIRRAFRGATPTFLRFNDGAIVRREYEDKQIICREGDYDSTAFMIESGKVDIYLDTTLSHAKSLGQTGLFGLVKKYTIGLVARKNEQSPGESRFIAIDAPVALDAAKPVAQLGPGDLFGEMTCLNASPRSATVRAAGKVVVFEMLRNVLYIMQRNKAFRATIEKKYRERGIVNLLRSVELFQPIREDPAEFARFVDSLRQVVKLTRADPGDVIVRQGARGDDGFYLVRSGFVKVAQDRPGGEHVLNYVGPGGYFGEIAMMADDPEVRALAPPGRRTATCSALDHVDLVQITPGDFRELLIRFPRVRQPLINEAVRRIKEADAAQQRNESMPLGDFLSQGLMGANSLLVLDLEKGTRCDECTKACADVHDGVTRLIREGLRFDKFLVASSCRSCVDPYCLTGCPVGAIHRKGGLEILIEDWCIGCGKCSENCPYGNINMHPFPKMIPDPKNPKKMIQEMVDDPDRPGRQRPVVQQKATACDLCHDLGLNDSSVAPSCVYACPHDAAHSMTGRELIDLVEKGHA